jgi:hypothetical protein
LQAHASPWVIAACSSSRKLARHIFSKFARCAALRAHSLT